MWGEEQTANYRLRKKVIEVYNFYNKCNCYKSSSNPNSRYANPIWNKHFFKICQKKRYQSRNNEELKNKIKQENK